MLKFLDKRATMIICSQIWTFFLILAVITSKYRKMKTTLHSYFFARNLNLQSELKNSNFLILTFLYPCRPLMAHKKSSKIFLKKFLDSVFIWDSKLLQCKSKSQRRWYLWEVYRIKVVITNKLMYNRGIFFLGHC